MVKPLLIVLVFALAIAACGHQAETCEEVADQTIEHAQRLIDDLESQVGETSVEDLVDKLASGEELPSVEGLRKRAAELSKRAAELGCTQEQFSALVEARIDRLHATTPVGEFVIEAIGRGGL